MSLIEKEIKWYPVSKNANKKATHHNKPHFMKKDVKEAILKFIKKTNNENKLSKGKVFRILEEEFGDLNEL